MKSNLILESICKGFGIAIMGTFVAVFFNEQTDYTLSQIIIHFVVICIVGSGATLLFLKTAVATAIYKMNDSATE